MQGCGRLVFKMVLPPKLSIKFSPFAGSLELALEIFFTFDLLFSWLVRGLAVRAATKLV